MSIARASSVANSYRFVRIMIDSYRDSRICGRIYHDSRDIGIEFKGLINMVRAVENILDDIQYPMRNMDIRRFERKGPKARNASRISEEEEPKEKPGELLSFRLMVKYRQNASWQGQIRREDTQETEDFDSFLELIQILDNHLLSVIKGFSDSTETWSLTQMHSATYRQTCNISIDDYRDCSPGGNLYAKQLKEPLAFDSGVQMAKQIVTLLNTEDTRTVADKKLINQHSLSYFRKMGKEATFCIRVLFKENRSLQGIMYWKERKTQVSFRSFLELLLLIDAAVNEPSTWQTYHIENKSKIV